MPAGSPVAMAIRGKGMARLPSAARLPIMAAAAAIIASERGNVAMMSREQNDQLSRVGPETLMGEKLICFRDSKGRIGLMDEFCAHRGVSLWFGQNEECGLRCPYHGWKY